MGAIAKDDQQLTIYFNSESTIGKQTLAYVSASSKKIKTVDLSKEKLTGTQWADLTDKLNIELSDLIDMEHPNFTKIYGNHEVNLEEHDWIKLLQKQPEIISWAFVVNGDQFLLIKNPSDVVKYIN